VFITRIGGFADVQVKLSDVTLATTADINRSRGERKIGGRMYKLIDRAHGKTDLKKKVKTLRDSGKYRSIRTEPRGAGIYLIYGRS
jgi:hypothetical protein